MVLSAALAARARHALHCPGCSTRSVDAFHVLYPCVTCQCCCTAECLSATVLSCSKVSVAGLQWFKKLELTVEPSQLKSGQQPPRAADIRPVSTEAGSCNFKVVPGAVSDSNLAGAAWCRHCQCGRRLGNHDPAVPNACHPIGNLATAPAWCRAEVHLLI